jgi:hypothetical protein
MFAMSSKLLWAFVLLMMTACQSADQEPVVTPTDARITKGSFKKELVLNGRVTAERSTKFRTPRTTSWRVDIVWMAPEGEIVQPGDPVLRFQNEDILVKIEEKNQELTDQKVALEEEEARIEQATIEHAEKLKLAEIEYKKAKLDAAIPKELLTEKEFQENQLTLMRARLAWEKAEAEQRDQATIGQSRKEIVLLKIREIEQHRENFQQMLKRIELNADTGGVVLYEEKRGDDRKWQVGDTATISESILYIPDMNSLRVHALVDEARLNWLHPGQPASIRLEAYPDVVFPGVVAGIANTGIKKDFWGKVPFFEVIIEFGEKDLNLLKPGMSVSCSVEVLNRDDLLLAPVTHVGIGPDGYLLQPQGESPIVFEPLAFNAFQVAFREAQGLAEGSRLQMLEWEKALPEEQP